MYPTKFTLIIKYFTAILLFLKFSTGNTQMVKPPEPYGVVPSERQLQWHDTEFYAFIHFTINTFTDKEWGFGDESPQLFNPSNFDAEQIVLASKNAGMKGLVLTTKHHDGFCLWPTATTEHNITKSPYKNGKGDIVREFVDACRKHGLKIGMYLSPWDRNNAAYGTPDYIDIFRAQLTELLTNYGDVFEVWFDGANGGTGYYGGANEKREIDRQTYYQWEETWDLVRELQPKANIFSDVGPDVRWVGTEKGYSGDPCWHRFTPEPLEEGMIPVPGELKYWESINGTREGENWIPAETNTSIRPGWFYHESENDEVKTAENLVDIHYQSIGHGTNFILNLPPDKNGLIPDEDIASLTGFREILDETFAVDLATGATVTASNVRGEDYSANTILDDNNDTYWATDDEVHTGSLTIDFTEEVSFNVVNIREYIPLGQRIWGWALDSWQDGKWNEFAKAESIGNRRLWRGPLQTTTKIRLRITEAPASPLISKISVHKEPIRLVPPVIGRNQEGMLNIKGNGTVRYTLDGSEPNNKSYLYTGPIDLSQGGTVIARIYDGKRASRSTTTNFGYYKKDWKIIDTSNPDADKAIDEDLTTLWKAAKKDKNTITIDFGKELSVTTLLMSPPMTEEKNGMVLQYKYYGSNDRSDWKLLAEGEFSNIFNNPIQQETNIDKANIRFIRLEAHETVGSKNMVVAELGIKVDN